MKVAAVLIYGWIIRINKRISFVASLDMIAEEKKAGNKLHPSKPFLKWAGSKRQLLNSFINIYPAQLKEGSIKNYYEPFLGSGAVFFDIAQRYKIEHACLCDVNDDLVLTYQVVQSNVCGLVEMLRSFQKKYLLLNKEQRQAYFYEQRELFNKQSALTSFRQNNNKSIERAARLIFLNRTCFNGLFRVNSKGAFNTPAGEYIKPNICDEETLMAASHLLKYATIKKADYKTILNELQPASFVYLDPPYRPLSKTSSFNAYNKSVFADAQQAELAQVCKELNKQGVLFMLSNSDTGDLFFENLYKDFYMMRIPAKRLINSDASKRGPVNEIIVTNYPM